MVHLLKITFISISLLTIFSQLSVAGEIRDPGAVPSPSSSSAPVEAPQVIKLSTPATDDASCAQLVPNRALFRR